MSTEKSTEEITIWNIKDGGQFLDHDITLVHTDANNPADIIVPHEDDFYSQDHIQVQILPFNRSETINNKEGRHPNVITSYIDGSNIYGSDKEAANNIRSHAGGRCELWTTACCPRVITEVFFSLSVMGEEMKTLL